ncbi:hypothetical protein JAAARDRAFT_27819 [Jaapia argillacea MUCL 33604]|uniref:RRM domain-containing protein n=1 Tax=Jaapia argillacea MUCL 33604 TaxID=933084 RepID=A0A067QKZ5_9AGAM|nr:hypothetical protein JAAARDRAFT_27819 [Jaapia argillacea MUCL 33604]
MDVNLPRDKNTGKTRGFGFLMYENQRSTVLAVDNLNGAEVLNRTLRVDHVKNYKQPKVKGEDGEWEEPEQQSLNAKPVVLVDDDPGDNSSASSGPEIDPDDPMRDYLIAQRKEQKALRKTKKSKSKGKHKDETPEERRARKERKKEKKAKKAITDKSEGIRGVEDLLAELERIGRIGKRRKGDEDVRDSPTPERRRSRSPPRRESARPRSPARGERNRSGSFDRRDDSRDRRRYERDSGRERDRDRVERESVRDSRSRRHGDYD